MDEVVEEINEDDDGGVSHSQSQQKLVSSFFVVAILCNKFKTLSIVLLLISTDLSSPTLASTPSDL